MLVGMDRPLTVEILATSCTRMKIAPTVVGLIHAVIRAVTLQHNRVGKREEFLPANKQSLSLNSTSIFMLTIQAVVDAENGDGVDWLLGPNGLN